MNNVTHEEVFENIVKNFDDVEWNIVAKHIPDDILINELYRRLSEYKQLKEDLDVLNKAIREEM